MKSVWEASLDRAVAHLLSAYLACASRRASPVPRDGRDGSVRRVFFPTAALPFPPGLVRGGHLVGDRANGMAEAAFV